MDISKKIKDLRVEYKLTQEQLGQAVGLEKTCISHYENSRRLPDLYCLEKIANVFGRTLELNLIEKKEIRKEKDFYLDKTLKEIKEMSTQDLTEYIFVTQTKDLIATICNTTPEIISRLTLNATKELIEDSLKSTNRASLYFKLNNLYSGLEDEMAYFIDILKGHIEGFSNLDKDILQEYNYISVEIDVDIEDGTYYFTQLALLDKDKQVLTDSYYDIIGVEMPLESVLDDELSNYMVNHSSVVIEAKY